ncbi:hypothetical protein ACFLTX_00620 [Chloroflexota bacterium]
MDNEIQMVDEGDESVNWKTTTIIVGGILGAVTGLGAAYLMVRRAEQQGEKISMTSGQGLKLGVLLAGLLRSVLNLSED